MKHLVVVMLCLLALAPIAEAASPCDTNPACTWQSYGCDCHFETHCPNGTCATCGPCVVTLVCENTCYTCKCNEPNLAPAPTTPEDAHLGSVVCLVPQPPQPSDK